MPNQAHEQSCGYALLTSCTRPLALIKSMKKQLWFAVLLITISCGSGTNSEVEKAPVGEISAEIEKEELSKNLQNCSSSFDNAVYEYQPDPSNPEEKFILRFTCSEDTLKGEILGPAPAGEHGLFYFYTSLDSLQTDGKNSLDFQFAQGKLYEEQITLANYKKFKEENASGISKGKIYLKGAIAGDSLIFRCTSQYYDCYADEMVFKLKK
jgi:hypothetical protein